VIHHPKLRELVARPHLIPAEWRGFAVFFKDAVHMGSCGNLCVECLWYFPQSHSWHVSAIDMNWIRSISRKLVFETVLEGIKDPALP